MSVDIKRIKKLNDMVSLSLRMKHTIVIDPEEKEINGELNNSIIVDKGQWKITEELQNFIDKISKDSNLSKEDKILLVFEKICKDYVYDDNLISYIKKIDDDTYDLPDWYGRDIDSEWEKNREKHNRRICFELSRYLAKGLSELLKENEDYNVCIHWNKNLTHYMVGLTCDDYSITLDTDDFFKIKDLTRMKTGLTVEGINILEDKKKIFKDAIDRFNEGRSEYAIQKIQEDIKENDNNKDEENINNDEKEDKKKKKKIMEILTNKYNLDSQGIYEYMKEIVDIGVGSEKREKVWKRIEGETKNSTRYIRCLVINIEGEKYLIDVDSNVVRHFDEKELREKRAKFVPFNDLSRGGFDYYDGT